MNDWGHAAARLDCWALWACVDGFGLPRDQDAEGFALWPLSRLVLAADIDGGRHVRSHDPAMVVFADYLGWCWAYAIAVDGQSADYGAVFLIGTSDGVPLRLAASFDDFLALYLDGSVGL